MPTHSSRTHRDIPNKPNKTNWVEEAGHLPKYIERIAKHLKADEGYTTSRAIATAVNTVKRWARGGKVVEGGSHNVNADTQAKAAKALASWTRKKNMSEAGSGRATVELALKNVGGASPSSKQRKQWAKEGVALPDGSFPIPDKKYLIRAIKAFGRANESDRAKVKRHILKRARALGASEDQMKRAKELNLANGETIRGKRSGKGFQSEEHLRSPQTGQFVPKNQAAAKSAASQRSVETALTKMKEGDRKALPDDLGWVEKTKSGFTVVGPGGFRKSVATIAEAQNTTDQIINSAQRSNA